MRTLMLAVAALFAISCGPALANGGHGGGNGATMARHLAQPTNVQKDQVTRNYAENHSATTVTKVPPNASAAPATLRR